MTSPLRPDITDPPSCGSPETCKSVAVRDPRTGTGSARNQTFERYLSRQCVWHMQLHDLRVSHALGTARRMDRHRPFTSGQSASRCCGRDRNQVEEKGRSLFLYVMLLHPPHSPSRIHGGKESDHELKDAHSTRPLSYFFLGSMITLSGTYCYCAKRHLRPVRRTTHSLHDLARNSCITTIQEGVSSLFTLIPPLKHTRNSIVMKSTNRNRTMAFVTGDNLLVNDCALEEAAGRCRDGSRTRIVLSPVQRCRGTRTGFFTPESQFGGWIWRSRLVPEFIGAGCA